MKMIFEIERIRLLAGNEQMAFKRHALQRMAQRKIRVDDVKSAILTGSIIEEYPGDYPLPRCLIAGKGVNSSVYHVVAALGEDMLWIITVYQPSLSEWESDLQTRRQK